MKSIAILVLMVSLWAHAAEPKLDSPDYYQRLGLSEGASIEEVNAAHRKLAKIYHPDVRGSDQEMQLLNEARDGLRKGVTRAPERNRRASPGNNAQPSRNEAPLSPTDQKSYEEYKNRFEAELKKAARNQADTSDFPITTLYTAAARLSQWKLDGTNPNDNLNSLPLRNEGERRALRDLVEDYMRSNLGFRSATYGVMLLESSRVELINLMLTKNFPTGDEYQLVEDLFKSMYRTTAANSGSITAVFNAITKQSIAYDKVGIELYGAKFTELMMAYQSLSRVGTEPQATRQQRPQNAASSKSIFQKFCETIARF